MAVAYRASAGSTTGADDTQTNPRVVNKPIGTLEGDIALVGIEFWSTSNAAPTVDWASRGFAQVASIGAIEGGAGGFVSLKAGWKRVAAGESASWSFAFAGGTDVWNLGHSISISGALAAGDPIDVFNTASVPSGTTEPAPSVIATLADMLVQFISRENGGLQSTTPTGFTEVQDGNVLTTNYRILASPATVAPTGGVSSVSTTQLSIHIGVKPAGGIVTSDALKRDKQMRLGALLQM